MFISRETEINQRPQRNIVQFNINIYTDVDSSQFYNCYQIELYSVIYSIKEYGGKFVESIGKSLLSSFF